MAEEKGVKLMLISITPLGFTKHGKGVVMNGLASFLQDSLGPEDFQVVTLSVEEPSRLGRLLAALPKPSAAKRLRAMLTALLFKQRALQEAVYRDAVILKELQETVEHWQPDLILCDTTRSGQYFMTGPHWWGDARLMIYLDDLYSVRYQTMLEIQKRRPDLPIPVLGNFGRLLPALAQRLVDQRKVQRFLLEFERDRMRESERRAPECFERCFLINGAEVKRLKQEVGRENIYELKPLLVGQFEYNRAFDGRPEFVFVGDLNVTHNEVSTFDFLASQINHLRALMPDVCLRIIGPGSSDRLARLAQSYPRHIKLEGFVEDLDAVLNTCTALVAPLLFGSGIKIKMLEALARGVPVLTTDFGVEGITGLEDQKHMVLENDLSLYPRHMLNLTEPSRNTALSQGAYQFYTSRYAPGLVQEEYRQRLLE